MICNVTENVSCVYNEDWWINHPYFRS